MIRTFKTQTAPDTLWNFVANNYFCNHAVRIIQRQFRIYLNRKKHKAAKIIQHGCANWIWKPICKDGTLGIKLRLDLQYLKLA